MLVPTTDAPAGEAKEIGSSFFGTEDQPHWLTKLILLQIFEGGTPHPLPALSASNSAGSPGGHPAKRKSVDGLLNASNSNTALQQQQQKPAPPSSASRTHSRSEIIGIWARVGELCRLGGDECTWRAICAALCSRPVARLEKAWKRVDVQALAAVEAWVSPSPDKFKGVNDPQCTPWAGDLKRRLASEVAKAKGEGANDVMLSVNALTKGRRVFEEFRRAYVLCPRNAVVREGEVGNEVKRMVAFWKDVAEGGRTSGMAIKFQRYVPSHRLGGEMVADWMNRVEQFMSLSLAVEPRRKGLFEPYFWQQRTSTSQVPNAALIPLLFPEILPTQTLVDRTNIVRSRVESDAMEVQQYLRNNGPDPRPGSQPLQRVEFNQDFTKKLILGQSGPVISVYNGDLLLMVQPGALESLPPSRPPSSMADHSSTTGSVERTSVSRAPSIRVKPSTSHELSRKTSMARRSSLPTVPNRQNQSYVISETSSEPPLRVIVRAGSLDQLVNVLVFGLGHISVSVADDNGEMSLKEGMIRELVVDRAEFGKIWWSSFRSFVTPLVFFEVSTRVVLSVCDLTKLSFQLLRKLYITSQPTGSSPSADDYLDVAMKRGEVLTTMKEWLSVGGGAQDALDDSALYTAIQAFLESSTDHIVYKGIDFDLPQVQQAWSAVTDGLASLKACFISQTRRPTPNITHNSSRFQPIATEARARRAPPPPRELPDIDQMDPEAFVDNIDGMASAAFSNLTEEVRRSVHFSSPTEGAHGTSEPTGPLHHCRSSRSPDIRQDGVVLSEGTCKHRGSD